MGKPPVGWCLGKHPIFLKGGCQWPGGAPLPLLALRWHRWRENEWNIVAQWKHTRLSVQSWGNFKLSRSLDRDLVILVLKHDLGIPHSKKPPYQKKTTKAGCSAAQGSPHGQATQDTATAARKHRNVMAQCPWGPSGLGQNFRYPRADPTVPNKFLWKIYEKKKSMGWHQVSLKLDEPEILTLKFKLCRTLKGSHSNQAWNL